MVRYWGIKRRAEGSDMTSTHHMPETKNYQFFNHAACEFYPCHDMPAEELNCLFCYCPLHALGERCGGNFVYIEPTDGTRIKDCSACTVPHRRENYDYIMKRLCEWQAGNKGRHGKTGTVATKQR